MKARSILCVLFALAGPLAGCSDECPPPEPSPPPCAAINCPQPPGVCEEARCDAYGACGVVQTPDGQPGKCPNGWVCRLGDCMHSP